MEEAEVAKLIMISVHDGWTVYQLEGGVYLPPWRMSRFSIGKQYQRGVKVVCKLKFSKL